MKITAKILQAETNKVFNELFTIKDILSGNNYEMNLEARHIALQNLKTELKRVKKEK